LGLVAVSHGGRCPCWRRRAAQEERIVIAASPLVGAQGLPTKVVTLRAGRSKTKRDWLTGMGDLAANESLVEVIHGVIVQEAAPDKNSERVVALELSLSATTAIVPSSGLLYALTSTPDGAPVALTRTKPGRTKRA
jgi:hypothetical protein